MSEIILSEFKSSGVPAVGLTPTITIRKLDWTIVVSADNMIEIANGRYKYDFEDYNKRETYLIDTEWWVSLSDSERYQNTTNILDAYPNKNDWKWSWGGWVSQSIDTKQLAIDVWKVKTKEAERWVWTIWRHVAWLDTKSVIQAIEDIDIPDPSKELDWISQKSAEILKSQIEIQWKIEKQWKNVIQTVTNTQENIKELSSYINLSSDKILDKVESISWQIKDIEQIDYEKIEKSIIYNQLNLEPIILEMGKLKFSIIEEIKVNNYIALKEFVKELDNSQIVMEISNETKQIKNSFEKSIIEIKNNIDILSQKEIDFSPIFKEFIEISQKMEEWTKNISEWLSQVDKIMLEQTAEQYKKSMKYIIYIAKNIGNINKNELKDIKTALSSIKK